MSDRAMARLSHFVRVPLLLICLLHASDSRHVQRAVGDLVSKTGDPEVDDILSKIPIPILNATSLDNVSIMKYSIRLCSGMKEELTSLNVQLLETTQDKDQLDAEAFRLRQEIQQLSLNLNTCTSALPSVAVSSQTQLQTKMNNLLDVIDSETLHILKIMTLTRDMNTLQNKIKAAALNKTSTMLSNLQKELDEKTNELSAIKQKIDRNPATLTLILQIISLQNQILDLRHTELTNETSLQLSTRILALQEQLDGKVSELRVEQDSLSVVLELISVRSKVAVLEQRVKLERGEIRSRIADAQRQWRQKGEQLKRAIRLLSEQENDKNLTRIILKLQGEVELLEKLISDLKERPESTFTVITEDLEAQKKREAFLQLQLEEADYAVAQLILKIISIMEELREQAPTGQHQDVLALLQTYKRDYATAQAELKQLKEKLRQTLDKYSGLGERHTDLQKELDQKLSGLGRTEDSKAALILKVISLHAELRALEEQISASVDAEVISNLRAQLQEKQGELNSKTADVQGLVKNPQLILQIVKLQNDIWELQIKSSHSSADNRTELQKTINDLINEISDQGQDNTKQMLKIVTLWSQVEHLQALLSNEMLDPAAVTQLTAELTARDRELSQHISELTKKNQANAHLFLTITELQSKLRKLRKEQQTKDETTSAAIFKLREELRIKAEENQHYQTVIKALQSSSNQTEGRCSENEQKVKDLENNLESRIDELKSKSDTMTSLTLQISTLTVQLEELNRQLANSVSKSKVEELQRAVDEKKAELDRKTKELKERSAQAQRFLQIIAIQVEIEKQANTATNDTDYARIRGLQDHLSSLIDGINDKDNESTKLTFQILARQDEIAQLKKQKERQLEAQAERINDLESELEHIRNQIRVKTLVIDSSGMRITNLSAQIMELHRKIQPLEEELSDLKETHAENLAELQERLDMTKNQLQDNEILLKQSDAKNFQLIMEIAELRAQLKSAQKQESKAARKSIADLEKQVKTQERENKKLVSTNADLKQQVEELNLCCTTNTQCEGIQRELQQSQELADNLYQLLQAKEAALKELQADFDEQAREKAKLQEDHDSALRKLNEVEDITIQTTKITLDPNTAHPRIALSADGTEVSTTDRASEVQDNPGRFDVILAVLGSTGFSRGRHYWEVSVAEMSCYHIGMASEAARRKGSLSFKPTTGFWTIVLNRQGNLRALDQKSVVISAEIQPLTVGILLDYTKGQISFYNAGARSHMYTFTGQAFTNKIYPFVHYCVEGADNPLPMVLVPPGSTDWIK
ncbi:putative leucine-rich repeat-containing protein DDB_G0290503 [Kryptolebias marmoratus]|uniref:putative leucine-rich repeat-containing protein DDB_G0290503 n=1 Tax=Kryptolebias marmoratus TaxID=37003 RepID=UPI0007F8FDD6|nr:putative leucine-rich repeat-containing protein DDB_G0290503 [Kryptolebias marmoratus]